MFFVFDLESNTWCLAPFRLFCTVFGHDVLHYAKKVLTPGPDVVVVFCVLLLGVWLYFVVVFCFVLCLCLHLARVYQVL